MPTTPYVLEFGMGVDVHGQDSTTAARRAVKKCRGAAQIKSMRLPGGLCPPVDAAPPAQEAV